MSLPAYIVMQSVADNFGKFTAVVPPLLNSIDLIHRIVGPRPLEYISQKLNKMSGNMVPVWSPAIPKVWFAICSQVPCFPICGHVQWARAAGSVADCLITLCMLTACLYTCTPTLHSTPVSVTILQVCAACDLMLSQAVTAMDR